MFKAKGKLHPHGMKVEPLPPQNRRKRGGPAWADGDEGEGTQSSAFSPGIHTPSSGVETSSLEMSSPETSPPDMTGPTPAPPYTESEALARLAQFADGMDEPALRVAPAPDAATAEVRARQADAQVMVQAENGGLLYCPECYLPLHPDPRPERLYIFLHALRYTTKLGTFETQMPEWATEGWEWDRS